MWLAKQTIADIANDVSVVARYASKPRQVHWRTVIAIFEHVLLRVILI